MREPMQGSYSSAQPAGPLESPTAPTRTAVEEEEEGRGRVPVVEEEERRPRAPASVVAAVEA